MNEDERISDLLLRWEKEYEQGRDILPEELCRDCPELTSPVREGIEDLKRVAWLSREDDPVDTVPLVACRLDTQDEIDLPAVLAGRFRLDGKIAEGGFGKVWRGFDLKLQRPVAVKVPKLDRLSNQEAGEAFLAEARKVARLKHPGIVPVHDLCRHDGVSFIVSDLIEGEDLGKALQTNPPSLWESVRIVAEAARHLHHAHQHGLIHRDVKPSNLLVDMQCQVYITDFGIAISDEEVRRHGAGASGTLSYMSPEQLAGEHGKIDPRTDIYSLGVVLYELLTQQLPFTADTPGGVIEAIRHGKPICPRSINRTIHRQIERICLRCLEKRPSDRYLSAEALADDLVRWLTRKPWSDLAEKSSMWIWGTCALLTLVLGWIFHSDQAGKARQEDQRGSDNSKEDNDRKAREWYEFGKECERKREYTKAIEAYTAAIQLNPSLAEYVHARGNAYLLNTDCDKAIGDFTRALRLSGRGKNVLFFKRGYAYLVKRDWDQSILDFTKAIRLNPGSPGPDPTALQVPIPDRKLKYNNAVTFYKEQMGLTDQTIHLIPSDAAARCLRGACYLKLRDYYKALADFNEAAQLNPHCAVAHTCRGIAKFMLNDLDGAATDFDTALRIDSVFAQALNWRATVFKAQRQYEKAINDYESAICLDPADASSKSNLAWLLATVPDEKLRDGKRAIEHAKEGCELTKWTNGNQLGTLAAAYAEIQDFAAAVKWQRLALGATAAEEPSKGQVGVFDCFVVLPGSVDLPEIGIGKNGDVRLKLYEERKPYREQ